MTKLSVNINKVATIRNSRGGNNPDVVRIATCCELFGADGITVHPRPDERHIKYADVRALKPIITTELNIEGNPIDSFVELILEVKPKQVTLVPDAHDQLTSNHGWNTIEHRPFLTDIISTFRQAGVRTSIFINADPRMVEGAVACGADRVELYTEPYAATYDKDRAEAIAPFIVAAKAAHEAGIGLNAGHDLSLVNLHYYIANIPWTDEVSIGHALISDALYMGLRDTIEKYKQAITQ